MSNHVAETILQQLGGKRFAMMTNSKNFIAGDDYLAFSIHTKTRNKANKVKIILDPSDTYTVEFYNIRGVNLKLIERINMVYNDMLQEIFTNHTGLYTKL